MNKIPYGRQDITEADIQAVVESLTSDFLTQGPRIEEFEKKFADFLGVKYAIAVANGTAALHLSAIALNVNKQSKVICSPITFAASINCVSYCGGQVYLVDVDPSTALIDLQKLEDLLRSKPKGWFDGVVAVDYAGSPVDLEKLSTLAKKYDFWILEDSCHAPGGYFNTSDGNRSYCGSCEFADLAIFSFHPVKHIACGEGGMITTNNESHYVNLKKLRTHGITKDPNELTENPGGWYYEMVDLGYNYRLSDIQASLGISQLSRISNNLRSRRELAKVYDEAFEEAGISFISDRQKGGHAYHLYVIHVNNRKEVYDKLREFGIYSQVHYVPLHYLPYYSDRVHYTDLSGSEQFYNRCLSLPMYPTLKVSEQQFVIEKVLEYAK